jgi:hypothetical protein
MSDCPRGPDEHKTAARELIVREPGKRPRTAGGTNLLVLAPDNDPFYCGTPAHLDSAHWFAGIWAEHGGHGAHLRHIHYRAFTAGAALLDGSRYPNNERTWKVLQQASSWARYLGLVDPERLRDQRNDQPVIGTSPRTWGGRPAAEVDGDPDWPELPSVRASLPGAYPDIPWMGVSIDNGSSLNIPGITVTGYEYDPADQPVLLEVWSEKSSVDDTMVPLSRTLHINYVPGTGYLSITRIIELLRRAEEHGKPAHVLYVSDYDPAGLNMPRQVARQVQFWRDALGIDAEITLHPVALTAEQVARYNLPQAPDSGNVELDALIALHPGALESIIREAVAEWRDDDIRDQLSDTGDDAQESAEEQWADSTSAVTQAVEEIRASADTIITRYAGRLRQVVAEAKDATAPLRAQFSAIATAINSELEPYRQQAAAIEDEAAAELASLRDQLDRETGRYEEIAGDFAPALPERPEAECAADRDDLLYDSDRDWLDQLNVFRQSRGELPLEDGSSGGRGAMPWREVYNSLSSGNGRDGIEELTDAERGELVVALAEAGHLPARISEMTGISRTTINKYTPGLGSAVTMTCRREACGKTFTGRSNARYCSKACSKAAYRERTA